MLAYDYTNILLNLKDVLVTNITTTKNTISIFVKQKRKPHICPICCSVTDKIQCIVSDPKNRKLLDILPTRKTEDLYAYFTSFPMKDRLSVQYVVMDLSALFSGVIRLCFPNAKIVTDKFHVCRLANWAMEFVRKEEQKNFGTCKSKLNTLVQQ